MTTIRQLEQHGVPVSATSGPLETRIVVYDVDQLRSLLDHGLDEHGRRTHYQALFDGIATPDDAGAKLAQRVAAHVIGNTELSAQDRTDTAPVFPLTVHVSAGATPLVVNSRYDLSTPDGSPRIVSFSDVTLEQGGYFVCQGTPLAFTCDTLTRTGNSGSSAADFNILGRTGATPATPPVPGGASQAAGGYPGECSSAGIAGHGGGPGNPGAAGTPGTAGSPGSPGTPSMQATITIQQTLTVPAGATLTVYSQSGPGGRGGDGGQGGPGQQGGNGGNGVTCGCTGNAGGSGGDGGNGGPGGAAGNGGNGVDAAGNVVIKVPTQADVAKVSYTTAPAPPGAPGMPGPGGTPGSGGNGGSGGKGNSGGSGGGTGSYGATGPQGQPGTVTGKAAQITVMPL
jgi:hypothetical protein